MKVLNISIALIILFKMSFGQGASFEWVSHIGGTSGESASSIAIDNSGNLYTTGGFEGTVDFDPSSSTFNMTSFGLGDIFVTKMDASGNLIWAKQIGGKENDEAGQIRIDNFDNIYLTGQFEDTADFDPGSGIYNLVSSGLTDIFICKLEANGSFIWAKRIGGTDWDEDRSLTFDDFGNVYTTGGFKGTVDFDPGSGTFNLASAGSMDIFVSKLNSNGDFIWARNMGGPMYETGISIDLNSSGEILTTGYFAGTADFDPGSGTTNLISNGNDDIFISKLDSNGNFIWAKNIGGLSDDFGFDLILDDVGNIYLTGIFTETVDFDPGSGVSEFTVDGLGFYDMYLAKYDSNGNFTWAKQIGGIGDEYPVSLKLGPTGKIFVCGYFGFEANFDLGVSDFTLDVLTANKFDGFIAKYDQQGNFYWAKQLEGNNDVYCWNIAVDISSNVYTAGFFRGDVDFDPGSGLNNFSSLGGLDGFVLKMRDLTVGIVENNISHDLKIYPNPTSGQFKIDLMEYHHGHIKIFNSLGSMVFIETFQGKSNLIIDLPTSLKDGMYIVKLIGEDSMFTQKLILKRD